MEGIHDVVVSLACLMHGASQGGDPGAEIPDEQIHQQAGEQDRKDQDHGVIGLNPVDTAQCLRVVGDDVNFIV